MKILFVLLYLALASWRVESKARKIKSIHKKKKDRKLEDSKEELDKVVEEITDLHDVFMQELQDKKKLRKRDLTPTLEKKEFNIDDYLNDIDKYDCRIIKNIVAKKKCMRDLEHKAVWPVGNFGTDPLYLFSYIKKHIYQPLGYEMQNTPNLSNILLHLTGLKRMSSLFRNKNINMNYKVMKQSIMNSFDDLIGKTSDVDGFEAAISQLVITMLRKLHVYWISLRGMKKIRKASEDTKNIIKALGDAYIVKKSFLSEVAKTLIEKIYNAYVRFIKAHYMFDYISKDASNVIAERMVERYLNACDLIKYNRFDYIKMAHEFATQIDMYQAFQILNFRKGVIEPKCLLLSKIQIIDRFIENFNGLYKLIQKDDPDKAKDIKDFTAILLLKFSHFFFIMFNFHAIADFATLQNTNVLHQRPSTVMVLNDLMNNMVLIPQICVHFLKLKECAVSETNRILNFLTSKYLLKRSTGGWGMLDYIVDLVRTIYNQSNSLVWSNFNIFKQYFFQNLFQAIYHFKYKFLISNDDCLDDLEDDLGNVVSDYKNVMNSDTNFALIDQFDIELYDKILALRGMYNQFVPYNKDPEILTSIQNNLYNFVSHFMVKFSKNIDEGFIKFLKKVKIEIIKWKANAIKSIQLEIHPAVLPLQAKALYPEIVHKFKNARKLKVTEKDLEKALDLEIVLKKKKKPVINFEYMPRGYVEMAKKIKLDKKLDIKVPDYVINGGKPEDEYKQDSAINTNNQQRNLEQSNDKPLNDSNLKVEVKTKQTDKKSN